MLESRVVPQEQSDKERTCHHASWSYRRCEVTRIDPVTMQHGPF
jgi:hypothetical protein